MTAHQKQAEIINVLRAVHKEEGAWWKFFLLSGASINSSLVEIRNKAIN